MQKRSNYCRVTEYLKLAPDTGFSFFLYPVQSVGAHPSPSPPSLQCRMQTDRSALYLVCKHITVTLCRLHGFVVSADRGHTGLAVNCSCLKLTLNMLIISSGMS